MRTTHSKTSRRSDAAASSGNSLEIRAIKAKELGWFDRQMGQYHYLGESRAVGDTMRTVALLDGKPVGLEMWGSAAYRLKDRDSHIGWTATQCAQRQKLIVQQRRFLLLVERGQYPNLASRILGKSIRILPQLWFEKFGYEPLLAETFTDIEVYEGTCYKAAGWLPLGQTKGFSRHRADFYVPNDRPKKLWIKELRLNAAKILRAPELPEECKKGAESNADGVLPLLTGQIESLHEALCKIPDPRANNRSFHIGAVLTIVAMAIFSGHRNLVQVVRFAKRLTNKQRIELGLPRFKPNSSYRKEPSYKVFYNLLRNLDVDQFAQHLSAWLSRHSGTLPTALAMDGKFIRDTVGLVCLVDHETGVPRAMCKASRKEGEGDDCELKASQRMIQQQTDLSGTLTTADALNCQANTAREIVSKGGDFLIQAKDNQKTVHKRAIAQTKQVAPLLPRPKRITAASTIET